MSSRTSPLPAVWPGRSAIASFVHSLHLLDLDQREDWPGINVQSFSTKSTLQHRVRCTEWALYYLFELYDAKVARDKLRPFFPPATSLQSVNLRAALLRQLTELKKNAILRPNIVLRKTMLDECKGDKFEELMAAFSMTVLRKTAPATYHGPHPDHLVPLILSHRRTTQRHLEERKEWELKARQQRQTIDDTINELSIEAAQLRKRKLPDRPSDSVTIVDALRENWVGDSGWVDAILRGTLPKEGEASGTVTTDSRDQASTLLLDLQTRVEVQTERLGRWQAYLTDVQKRNVPGLAHGPSTKDRVAPIARFTRHQNLAPSPESFCISPADGGLTPHHADIISSLEHDLKVAYPGKPVNSQYPPNQGFVSPPVKLAQATRWSRSLTTLSRSNSLTSDVSSQGTTVIEVETPRAGQAPHRGSTAVPPVPEEIVPARLDFAAYPSQPRTPPQVRQDSSLLATSRASIGQSETPRARRGLPQPMHGNIEDVPGSTVTVPKTKALADRSSLLERTRQSMSMLSNVLDDGESSGAGLRSRKPTHTRSKTAIDVTSQRRRLERAWSEESLASVVSKADLDLNADEENVFKSRPRLAMSPNLSPQRNSHDLWLESQLEAGMNSLTIDSSPEL